MNNLILVNFFCLVIIIRVIIINDLIIAIFILKLIDKDYGIV